MDIYHEYVSFSFMKKELVQAVSLWKYVRDPFHLQLLSTLKVIASAEVAMASMTRMGCSMRVQNLHIQVVFPLHVVEPTMKKI